MSIREINSIKFRNKVFNRHPDIVNIGEYIDAKTRITVGCGHGHTWEIIPTNLISKGVGGTCRICNPPTAHNKKSDKTFVLELFAINPNIKLLDKYIDAKTRLNVGCITCGTTWGIIPSNLLANNTGATCHKCYPLGRKKIHDDFILEVQEKYSNVKILSEYTGYKDLINIGYFSCTHTTEVVPNKLLSRGDKSTCIICNPQTSRKELDLLDYIKSIYTGWIETNDRNIISPKELDIVLPDLGIAIEFNGTYYHSEQFKDRYYHLDKTKDVESFGYRLIHINEDEWNDKQDIVKSRLKSILGLSDKVYARKCNIREIGFPKEFLEENHIQGAGSPSSINLGLFLQDELIAVMTFSTPKFSKDYDYELVRYCSLLDITVVGGASKLLKYFVNNYKRSIVSYSDKRWSTGNLYKKLGFEYSHTSDPNYKYFKGTTSLSRYQCQKHKLKDRFPDSFDPSLTEKEIMLREGYYPVYDCGNDVWVLK